MHHSKFSSLKLINHRQNDNLLTESPDCIVQRDSELQGYIRTYAFSFFELMNDICQYCNFFFFVDDDIFRSSFRFLLAAVLKNTVQYNIRQKQKCSGKQIDLLFCSVLRERSLLLILPNDSTKIHHNYFIIRFSTIVYWSFYITKKISIQNF